MANDGCDGEKGSMRLKSREMAWCGCWAPLFLALLILAGAGRGPGAGTGDLVQGEVVSMGIGGVDGLMGKYRPGAWVPVRVRLENRSGKQLAVRLGVEQVDIDGDKVLSLGQKVILDTTDVEGRDFWVYYWPRPDDELKGAPSVAVMDETGTQVLATIPAPAPKSGMSNVGIPQRDDTSMQGCRWVVVLGPQYAGWGSYYKSFGGTEATWVSFVDRAEGMPDNALGLDGVDTIVWEADKIRVSDLPADFQLKALLDWVRSGGHLIISVSSQAQEFLKGGDHLGEAMPMTFTGLREVDLSALSKMFNGELRLTTAKISQATGKLRPDAKIVANTNGDAFANNPLAVTGAYGRGAVTVLTIDASNADLNQAVTLDRDWMGFWNCIAGWQGRHDQMMSQNEFDAAKKGLAGNDSPVTIPPNEIDLGHDIPQQIDVAEFTHLGIAVAVIFLGIYWLAAGPIGHLVLRRNKVVHWSWWIFGATVVVGTGVAGLVVMFVHLTNYDLRHKTYVLGTVNSKDVSAVGYYGVFAPVNGKLDVEQPISGTPADPIGINYLAPMDVMSPDGVKPFADPQTYDVVDEKPTLVAPVFRSTLKKLQGRWTGELAGIDGNAEFVASNDWNTTPPFKGSLTNHTGYNLHDVEIVIRRPEANPDTAWKSYIFQMKDAAWKSGDSIDLAKSFAPEFLGSSKNRINLGDLLNWSAHYLSGSNSMGVRMGPVPVDNSLDATQNLAAKGNDELLLTLFDARVPDLLKDAVRIEPAREFGRAADATKLLNAAGAVIVARAGDISSSDYVPSPVPITVNNRTLPGKGEVTFVWAVPLTGVTATLQEIPTGDQFNSRPKNSENP